MLGLGDAFRIRGAAICARERLHAFLCAAGCRRYRPAVPIMASSSNVILCGQDFPTDGALAAFRFSGSLTGRSNCRNCLRRMPGLGDAFRIRDAAICACERLHAILYAAGCRRYRPAVPVVASSGNVILCGQDFPTDGAPAAFRFSGLLTGRGNRRNRLRCMPGLGDAFRIRGAAISVCERLHTFLYAAGCCRYSPAVPVVARRFTLFHIRVAAKLTMPGGTAVFRAGRILFYIEHPRMHIFVHFTSVGRRIRPAERWQQHQRHNHPQCCQQAFQNPPHSPLPPFPGPLIRLSAFVSNAIIGSRIPGVYHPFVPFWRRKIAFFHVFL